MYLKRLRLPPALALFLLSPIVGELLSGSAPPVEFFTPFGFTVMVLLYGGGAVTARELKVRWGKGMGSLLLLGAAYGVLEEGLMVASFQNPNWQDIGVLGVYGRWLGVNWVWAVELTAYHAIVSIAIPVILVELAYPEVKGEPWLGGIWRRVVPGLLLADVVFGLYAFSEFTGFKPPIPQYAFMVLLTVAFIYLAHRLPPDWARRGIKPMRRPRFYGLTTLLGAIACGVIFWVLPNALEFPLAPVFVILLGLLTLLGVIWLLASHDWRQATPMHRYGLAAGVLIPFIEFAFLQELDTSRLDDTSGMSLVGLAFLLGLLLLGRKLRKTELESIDVSPAQET
ncbi:MAG: hypothetical protein JSV27_10880 [Candidatus Bathyarchaeota archaeon]|nr:MAG: hypothetical protein JSV27_10880 [Candidatus Bathyarchaeota archaeon]